MGLEKRGVKVKISICFPQSRKKYNSKRRFLSLGKVFIKGVGRREKMDGWIDRWKKGGRERTRGGRLGGREGQ